MNKDDILKAIESAKKDIDAKKKPKPLVLPKYLYDFIKTKEDK